MGASNITVVITSVGRPRRHMLQRALASVYAQILEPDAVVIAIDTEREGAARTRQRGTEMVRTPLVAYLDDDDEMEPDHLRLLLKCMEDEDADLVYPWFTVVGGADPFPMHFGKAWNPSSPVQFPITYLAKVLKIREAGGWAPVDGRTDVTQPGEDWSLELRLLNIGTKIVHLPVRSWIWHHHQSNYSGMASKVDWNSVQ